MLSLGPLGDGDERELLPTVGRAFLGADPVVETVPRMAQRLRRRGARLLAVREGAVELGLAGYVPNPHNPRQAEIDVVAVDPARAGEMVGAVVDFLHHFERIESFVKLVADDAPAFRAAGFVEVGRLRDHVFAGGRYHDQVVLHAAWGELRR